MKKEKIIITIVCAVFLLLAGASNGFMDTMQFHYSISIFPKGETKFLGKGELFWNPKISWRNKYEDGDPKKGAKFLLSTGALVFLTDGWHLFQFLMLTFFQLAIVIPLVRLWKISNWWILAAFIPAKLLFSGTFILFFNYFLIKKPAS